MVRIELNKFLIFFKKIIKNKIYFNFLKYVITIGILFLLFRKINIHEVIITLKKFNLVYLVINLFLGIIALQYFSIIRLHYFLNYNHIHISFKKLTKFHYISMFFQSLLPSGFGSDIVKVYYLRNLGKLLKTGVIVFVPRIIGSFSYVLISYILLTIFNIQIENINKIIDINWIKNIFFIIVVGTLFFLFFKPFTFIYNRIKKKIKLLKYIYETEKTFNPKTVIIIFIYSLLIFFINVMMIYLFFKGLNIDVNIIKAFTYLPIVISITFIIPSINGMGVREYLIYQFFQQEIGSIENMLVLTIAMFLIYFGITISGGIVYFFKKSEQN